uniref:VWFA domain-containing protein n=1 Tax=Strongyloides venezuelensis TaxID=75913 RepID=A0A0K0FH89_STRVS
MNVILGCIIKLVLFLVFQSHPTTSIKLPSLNVHIIFDDMINYTYLSQENVKKNKNDVIDFILRVIRALDIDDYHSKIAVSRFTPSLHHDIHLSSVQSSQNVVNFFETFKIFGDNTSNESLLMLFPPLLPSVSEIVKETFSSASNYYRPIPAYNVILIIIYITDQLPEVKINENLFLPNGPIFIFQITIGKMTSKIKISTYAFSAITVHFRVNETKNLVELEEYLLNGIINFTQTLHTYGINVDLRWWSYLFWNIRQCQRFNLKETIAWNEICDHYYSTTLQLSLSTKATITILGCVGGLLLILLSILIINNSNVKQTQKQSKRKISTENRIIEKNQSYSNNKKLDDNIHNLSIPNNENKAFNENRILSEKKVLSENRDEIGVMENIVEVKSEKNEEDVDFKYTFDILFLIDDSNSISNSTFDEYKQFIKNFLDNLSASKIPEVSRIGVITFNRKPFLNIPFEKYNSFEKLKNAISNLNRNGGVTSLGKALNFANGYLLGQKTMETINDSNSHHYNNSNAENTLQDRLQFLVLLSDGHTKDTIDWEYQSLLREYSIYMVGAISKSYLEDMFVGLVKDGGKLISLKDSDVLTKYIYKKYTIFKKENSFHN